MSVPTEKGHGANGSSAAGGQGGRLEVNRGQPEDECEFEAIGEGELDIEI